MSDHIPEIHVLLMKVESRFGSLNRPADFNQLSDDIESITSEFLSTSTLKRLWGYVNYVSNPRVYTLDVLSRYLGYSSFSNFCHEIHNTSEFVSGFLTEECIASDNLKVGEKLRIGWDPDRMVVLDYIGDNRYKVLEVQNASLIVGDVFTLPAIVKGYPLYIPYIERNGTKTPLYVAGYRSGITLLKKL